jgi:hypothetical protein
VVVIRRKALRVAMSRTLLVGWIVIVFGKGERLVSDLKLESVLVWCKHPSHGSSEA